MGKHFRKKWITVFSNPLLIPKPIIETLRICSLGWPLHEKLVKLIPWNHPPFGNIMHFLLPSELLYCCISSVPNYVFSGQSYISRLNVIVYRAHSLIYNFRDDITVLLYPFSKPVYSLAHICLNALCSACKLYTPSELG